MGELTHSTAAVTVEIISKPSPAGPKNENDVEFDVKYPDGYNGPKHMPEGIVTVSKEAAEHFTKMGIGKVAEQQEKKEESSSANTGTADGLPPVTDYSDKSKAELQALLTEKQIFFKPAQNKQELIALLTGETGN